MIEPESGFLVGCTRHTITKEMCRTIFDLLEVNWAGIARVLAIIVDSDEFESKWDSDAAVLCHMIELMECYRIIEHRNFERAWTAYQRDCEVFKCESIHSE